MSEAIKAIDDFKRKTLSDLLAQCTEPQQNLFHRLYPNGVSEEQLAWAIRQCERTIENNLKKRKEEGDEQVTD